MVLEETADSASALERLAALEKRYQQQQAVVAELQEIRTAAVQEATQLQDQVQPLTLRFCSTQALTLLILWQYSQIS